MQTKTEDVIVIGVEKEYHRASHPPFQCLSLLLRQDKSCEKSQGRRRAPIQDIDFRRITSETLINIAHHYRRCLTFGNDDLLVNIAADQL